MYFARKGSAHGDEERNEVWLDFCVLPGSIGSYGVPMSRCLILSGKDVRICRCVEDSMEEKASANDIIESLSRSTMTSVKIIVKQATFSYVYQLQNVSYDGTLTLKPHCVQLYAPTLNMPCDSDRVLCRTRTHPFFVTFIASDVPASAAYFGSYEIIQRSLVPEGGSRSDLSISKTIFAGGMAGIFNWIVGIPPDVMKSRLQTGKL